MPGQYSKSELKRRELLKILESDDDSELMSASIELTKLDRKEGHLYQALALHLMSAKTCRFQSGAEEGKHQNGLAITYHRLWEHTGERAYFNQARAVYREAIQTFKRHDVKSPCAYALNNLAALLASDDKTEEAHKLLDEAGEIFTKSKERARLAEVDDTRARCYLREGKLNEALLFVNRSIVCLAELNERDALEVSRETHRQIMDAVSRKGEK